MKTMIFGGFLSLRQVHIALISDLFTDRPLNLCLSFHFSNEQIQQSTLLKYDILELKNKLHYIYN